MQAVNADFEFPEAELPEYTGPDEAGMYPATCIAIDNPKPSELANDNGEHPLTSIFHWRLDGYPDHDQWSYVNVQGRGPNSTMGKIHKAMHGADLAKNAKVFARDYLNGRAMLYMVENPNKPGYLKVGGYMPLPKKKARPAPVVVEESDEEEPF